MNLLTIILESITAFGALCGFFAICWFWRDWAEETANIKQQLKGIAMNQTELAAELRGIKALIQKIGTETEATLKKVLDLEAIIAAGAPVSEEVLTALAELKTQAQATDDLVPDAPPQG